MSVLTGVAQLAEHHLTNCKVSSLISGQGTSLGFRAHPGLGHGCERQPIDVSLTHQFLFLSSSCLLSLELNKIFKKSF